MTTDGAPREAYADPDFVIVRMTAVRALGSWEAAGCFQRIAWRCERDGYWTATMGEIAEEIGVSLRTAKRITTRLRDLGWVTADRENPALSTLTWRVVWAECQSGTPAECQPGTHSVTSESANLAPGGQSANLAPSECQVGTDVSANVALPPSIETGDCTNETTASQGDAKSKRGTRLPDDWWPDESAQEWFRQQPFARTLDPRTETAKFRDYWRAKAGKDGVKLDWTATWRNWMRNAAGYANGNVRDMPNRHDAPDSPGRAKRIAALGG